MSYTPANETPAQRRARLDKKNEVQRLYRLNRKKAAAAEAHPITVGATRAGSEPAAAPEKPKYTKAQRAAMAERAALARAALAKYRAEGKVFATKRKPKPPERAAAALMHDAGLNLPVPFERVARVRGEILDSGERIVERLSTNGHGVDMDVVADLVLAIAAKLSKR